MAADFIAFEGDTGASIVRRLEAEVTTPSAVVRAPRVMRWRFMGAMVSVKMVNHFDPFRTLLETMCTTC